MNTANTLHLGVDRSGRNGGALLCLDGKTGNVAQAWSDKSPAHRTVQNGSLASADTNDGVREALGYSFEGDDYLLADLALGTRKLNKFTLTGVFLLNDLAVNQALFSGIFGSGAYPRLYYTTATNELRFDYYLDGAVHSLSVANASSLLTAGWVFALTITGDGARGVKIYLNGVERATDSQTGAFYDTGNDATFCGRESILGYYLTGQYRYLRLDRLCRPAGGVLLEYNRLLATGYLDIMNDDFAKWSGSTSASSGAILKAGDSPYDCTDGPNTDSLVGFETKDGESTGYAKILSYTVSGTGYSFLAEKLSAGGSAGQTATSVKFLPAVSAGETIKVRGQIFGQALSASQKSYVKIYFYNETGANISGAVEIHATTAGVWEDIVQDIVVPTGATRLNWAVFASVGQNQTNATWVRRLRIFR